MAVIDVVTYNGEKELLDLRYNILKDHVDQFIVVEFDKTFTGKSKQPFIRRDDFPQDKYPKMGTVFYSEEHYGKYQDLAISSPNTQYGKGAEHWVREFMQKESIKDVLAGLNDDDIVFIGDVDEIWDPAVTHNRGCKIKLRVYSYWLNNLSNEDFAGTFNDRWGSIKDKTLNHLRSGAGWVDGYGGWHFTSMGGIDKVRQKLNDQYTEESYNTKEVQDSLELRLKHGLDYLGRRFTFTTDESHWPQFLKENKDKYLHLVNPVA